MDHNPVPASPSTKGNTTAQPAPPRPDRKAVSTTLLTVLGLCLLLGGYLTWQGYSRARLQHALAEQAKPILDRMKEREIDALVKPARDRIRDEFHALCFKVPDFVDEVCSDDFARHLAACRTHDEQQKLLLLTFKRTVTTDAEILAEVRELTDQAAQTLDEDWAACCEELTERWNLEVRRYGVTLTGQQLVERMQPTITAGLRRTAEQAQRPGRKSRLGASLGQIAANALALPVEDQGVFKGMPAFSAKNFSTVFDSVIGHVQTRPGDMRKQISTRLSDLGNLLGHDFREEIRSRLEQLHQAQEQAVEQAAGQQASELIHIL
jgi:hypothetical protein